MIKKPHIEKNAKTIRRIIEAVENPDDPKRLEAVAKHRFRELRGERSVALVMSVIVAMGALLLLLFSWPKCAEGQDQWAGLIIGVEVAIALCITQGTGDPMKMRTSVVNDMTLPRQLLLVVFIVVVIPISTNFIKPLVSPQVIAFLGTAFLSWILTVSTYNSILMWLHRERKSP